MNDKELLELAAKAAGYANFHIGKRWNGTPCFYLGQKKSLPEDADPHEWNPLTDDGDALRLAVQMCLLVDCASRCARPLPDSVGWFDGGLADNNAATRRAIVRAAAEIGKAMP